MNPARAAAFAAALAAIALLRPAHLDGAWQECGLLWLYLVCVVALPGMLLRRRFAPHDDAFELCVWGFATGIVLHLFCAELCLRLGAPTLAWLPCIVVGGLCWTRTRPAPAGTSWWWLALAAAAALRAHHRDPLARPGDYDADLVWHAGNAAEYLRGPLHQDPRVAGLAFDYHMHAYALPAVSARTLGLATAPATMSYLAALVPLLVVLAAALLARRLGGARAAAATGVALLIACDPALALRAAGFDVSEAWRSNAHFEAGLWNSPTTALGMLLFLAVLERTAAWLAAAPSGRRRLQLVLPLVVASWAMAGAKGSTAPVLVAGLSVAGAWRAWRERAWRQPLFLAAALVLLGAAPSLLRLAGAADGYAQSMFRFEPFVAFTQAASVVELGLGATASWLLFPLWLVVFFGAPLAWILWAAARGACATPKDDALVAAYAGCALAGAAAALLCSAAGLSQLFFAYNAVVCVAVLGGSACARLPRPVAFLLALPLFAAGAARVVEEVARHAQAGEPLPAAAQAWSDGAAALRRDAAPDALLLSRSDSMLLSAYAERRMALETPVFTARWHAARRDGRDPRAEFFGLAQQTGRACDGDAPAQRSLLERARASEAWIVDDGARLVAGKPVFASGLAARKVEIR